MRSAVQSSPRSALHLLTRPLSDTTHARGPVSRAHGRAAIDPDHRPVMSPADELVKAEGRKGSEKLFL
jgi:hypothetical protein